jgi:hypothetical protein
VGSARDAGKEVGVVESGMQGRRRRRGRDAGKEDNAGGGGIAGRKTARAGAGAGAR